MDLRIITNSIEHFENFIRLKDEEGKVILRVGEEVESIFGIILAYFSWVKCLIEERMRLYGKMQHYWKIITVHKTLENNPQRFILKVVVNHLFIIR